MAGDVVYVDALPYFDQGYDEPGVREAVRFLTYVLLKAWCYPPCPRTVLSAPEIVIPRARAHGK